MLVLSSLHPQLSSPRKRGSSNISLDPRFRGDGIGGMKPKNDSYFCAAIITSPHGIRGHVRVKCFLEKPDTFMSYSPYCNEKGEEAYVIDRIFSQDRDVLTIALNGIKDRNEAEHLKGAKLMVSRARLPHLPEDTFYHTDLMGLTVYSFQGHPLGTIHALYNFGAGDILEIKTLQGKLDMIPFTHAIVPHVDLKQGTVCLSEEGTALLKGKAENA